MKENILIIDSKSEITEYLEKSLDDNYKIYLATTLDMVVEYLNKYNFSLVIMDQSFEDLNDGKIDIKNPILILSNTKKTGVTTAKKYYLQKPFSFQDFLRLVPEIIRLNNENKEIFSIDTLSIDTEKHIVYRNSKQIILTKKEYTLILFLVKNKDKAVSRSDLLENVWGMQIDPFSNTIEAHIFSLRKKIDRGHKIKLIHTIPKFGYRVSVEK